ncbi:rhamnogalacturonate lyase precursor [mine drainage metagenome]|uniref:rhamnogalacturonan endolyase n=1 Tax=mine drainage metagenome TaxID=410659 RepID=A0A1J5RSP0_9ZZZZ
MLRLIPLLALAALAAPAVHAAAPAAGSAQPGVTLRDDGSDYVLSNAYVTAIVDKHTGNLVSLKYRGLELFGHHSGYSAGYWEQNTGRAPKVIDSVTIDPAANGGARAEVSVKGISEGRMLSPNAPGGGIRCDLELRYALGRDDSGVYTYAIYSHPADYPADHIGESRFAAKLNPDIFDWMTINAEVNKRMLAPRDWVEGTPLNMKEARRLNTGIYKGQVEHKYDYTAVQFDTPAYGWSSTRAFPVAAAGAVSAGDAHIGLWFINPSMEYLSGGPTKVELTGHLDLSNSPDPVLLNYWRGTHYGGSFCPISKGEDWSKVVGPMLIYCNAGTGPQELWHDALRQAASETHEWPYAWVNGVDYPHADQRAVVTGRITVEDPQEPGLHPTSMLVGLSAPDYTTTGWARFGHTPPEVRVGWQTDAKHYEFWVRTSDNQPFTIPNVRPGTYVFHAIADGVLGEFASEKITLKPGEHLDVGRIVWHPVRYGRQLWDIGIPNRSAREFFHGDDYRHWGLYLQYPKWFPQDVDYTIGKSDFRKDWNFEQVPRAPADDINGREPGTSTTWTVHFTLTSAALGDSRSERAILRLALCGIGTRHLYVTVNDRPVGELDDLRYNAVINRDGIQGLWSEHDVIFPASALREGANTLKLTIPGGNPTSGIEYDYLRLELAPDHEPAKRS